jgi:hypothetical protein
MSANKSFKSFDMQEPNLNFDSLELRKANYGMSWREKDTDNSINIYLPAMKVELPPQPSPGLKQDFSMSVSVYQNNNNDATKEHKNDAIEENLIQLDKIVKEKAIKFLLENGKKYTGKDFKTEDDVCKHCKINGFWNKFNKDKPGNCYVVFNNNVVVQKFDMESSQKEGVKKYVPVLEDVRKYLGSGSLISLVISAEAFYSKKTDKMYSFSLRCRRMIIWNYVENKDPNAVQNRMKKHSYLERGKKGFSLNVPFGCFAPEQQKEIPVHDIESYDFKSLIFSPVMDKKDGTGLLVFARSDDNFGPLYFRGKCVIRYEAKKDPNYGNRNLVLGNEEANQPWFRLTEHAWNKFLDVVENDAKKVLKFKKGVTMTKEQIRKCFNNPLYSQNDVDKTNPRINFKLPMEVRETKTGDSEKTDKANFDAYILRKNEDSTHIEPLDLKENCDELEQYLLPGTEVQVIVSPRPSIVNDKIYWSYNVVQLMIDPEQERVVAPLLSGFAFPNYKDVHVECRSTDKSFLMDEKNIHFSDLKISSNNRKYIDVTLENGEECSKYITLPKSVLTYDIGLEYNKEQNKYPYRLRFNFSEQEKENKELFDNLDSLLFKEVKENYMKYFQKKSEDDVIIMQKIKTFVKYSESDEEQTNPYWAASVPVYEKLDGFDFSFEAYRYVPPVMGEDYPTIHKFDIKNNEDLLNIFYQGAQVQLIVTWKIYIIDGTIRPKFTVAQVLLHPSDSSDEIPFVHKENMEELAFQENAEISHAQEITQEFAYYKENDQNDYSPVNIFENSDNKQDDKPTEEEVDQESEKEEEDIINSLYS